ncbi:hypothetical protein RJ639_013130 [Escallonia herrerae]|uniref:30S ribosomal protein 3, chloroplastic n=1 Tax=Escallonia herrerae TaxID=1293975 RepID=A0AA88VHC6_9ASTE|nr:hypothetical protein RJ639_013130 [Escallonia herrerae]
MLSMSIQSGIQGTLTCPSFPCQKPSSSSPCPPFSLRSLTIVDHKTRPTRRIATIHASATAEAVIADTPTEDSPSATHEESDPSPEAEKLKVAVKQMTKPRLVLKFIWMEKNIGLGLDQVIPGHGTIPLSPYYFWPRKDAWEELKTTLESKPWISQKKMIILLNQATDIINLWQQSGGNLP